MSQNKFTIQKSFAISAGAGSGKTYTLSRRFINILLGFDFFIEEAKQKHYYEAHESKKADLDQIVTITYTEAAALEMKERIFGLINKILNFKTLHVSDGDYTSIAIAFDGFTETEYEYIYSRLIQAKQEISEANITTIHGFCLGVLKRHSDVAKVDGSLDVLDDDTKQKIFSDVYFKVFNSQEYQDKILAITPYVSLYKSQSLIAKYVFSSKFRASFDSFVHGKDDAIKELLVSTFLEALENDIELAYEELDGDARHEAFDTFVKSFASFNAQKYTEFTAPLGAPKSLGKKFPFTVHVKNQLESLISYFSPIDSKKEHCFIDIISTFQTLLKIIKSEYDAELKAINGTDFDTIIQHAAKIMPHVLTDFRYIMVDEFQDTNALQWDIVKEAAKGSANLFVVGDEKQSIYAFQGGEIEVFHKAIEEKFADDVAQMSRNFRSDKNVISFVNTIFESIFAPTLLSQSDKKQIVNNFEAAHQDLEADSKEEGSVSFLVTCKDDEESEANNLAQFIKSIVDGERHSDITQRITEKKQAIAILYDAKSKMLALKEELLALGVKCKVRASDNYYHTTEITDIFFVLKALSILKNKSALSSLSSSQKFFLAGAMRSNIMHFTDKQMYEALNSDAIPEYFTMWIEKASQLPLHTLVSDILSQSSVYSAYALMDNYEQRLGNIDKFLSELITYEKSQGYDLNTFVHQLEQSIYHSEAEEDEAYYRSSTGGSIELCSIHATKGLAYPMVVLADSAKSLAGQVTSESIKFNTLKDSDDELYNLVGFKIEAYEPLSLRILKEIDRRKHMAEKKRLYYVALTRAEHHLVISANLKATKTGVGSIKDSYLEMTLDALKITKEQLFDNEALPEDYTYIYKDDLKQYAKEELSKEFTSVKALRPISFGTYEHKSATSQTLTLQKEDTDFEMTALRGTLVHKALELFWNDLDNDDQFEKLFVKEAITDTQMQEEIKLRARNFKNTDIYSQLQAGAEHSFEFGFEEMIDNELHKGSIDLLLKSPNSEAWSIIDFKSGIKRDAPEYDAQLDFYKKVMTYKGMQIAGSEICWLGEYNTKESVK